MLRLLSALASLTILLGMAGVADAQCPPATIGVYAEPAGTTQSATPIQHQELFLYVIFFAEAPIAGAAWQLEMTSPQYPGQLVGPPGPNCQPPWCEDQDPPFWHIATQVQGPLWFGDPFDGGIRQGLGDCFSGFFGNPVLLATVILEPWAEILGSIEVDIAVVPEEYDGLVYADCEAILCDSVVGLTTHLGATVVKSEEQSWGAMKALYR